MTKSFMMFLALVVALGISIGGSFAGGVAFGRSQDNEVIAAAPSLASAGNFGGNFGQPPQTSSDGGNLPENLAQLRQRIQSGDVSPEDLAQLREQFQSGEASPEQLSQLRERFGGRIGGGPGPGFGEGVTGTVDAVEGNQVTVETDDGPRIVRVGQETVIQMPTAGSLEDLQQGVRIAAFGGGAEDGAEARFIVLLPEGDEGNFGTGFFFNSRESIDGATRDGAEGFRERRFRRDGEATP